MIESSPEQLDQNCIDRRSDQVDEDIVDSDVPEVSAEIQAMLKSSIPEIRVIGHHFLHGLDGHPFNTGDAVADSRPLHPRYAPPIVDKI